MKYIPTFGHLISRYRRLLQLAVPVVLAQIGQVVVQLVDNLMVGRLGALPLAGVSFGGAVFTIPLFFGTGLALGLTPIIGELFARKEWRRMAYFFQHSLLLYFVVGVILFGLLLLANRLLPYMGQTEDVVATGRPYFVFLSWSILPYMIYLSFKQFLEGIGNTRTAMIVVLAANVINIILNYLLIYGHWGLPAMGAAGSGLATLIARVCMPVFMLLYFLRKVKIRRFFVFFSWFQWSWFAISRLLKIGFPISVQMVLEVTAFALSSIMMGWVGTNALAAHQIVLSVGTLAFMVQVGIAAATTILVSHSYGRHDIRGIRRIAATSFHLTLCGGVLSMSCMILFRYLLPACFTPDPQVIAIASQLLILAGLYQLSDCVQILLVGILRGIQDVSVLMRYAFFSYIVINLPVGYLCAFVLGMGAPGLWVGFIFGLSIAALLYWRRYRQQIARLTGVMNS